jgi:predicted metal-dependent phosphoesterase TrpH
VKRKDSMKADLHIHSRYSNDGELSIPAIIKQCRESGIDTFAITDHNGIGGSREALGLTADDPAFNFIPGIEIDCNYKGTDLHLLGYQVDLEGDVFDVLEQTVRQKYMDAVPRMIANLERLDIPIDQEELMNKAGGQPPSGELFAELLLQKPEQHTNPRLRPYLPGGHRSDMPLINFYLDFFAQGKPAHVKIDHLDFGDAIALVRSNGGIPVVAHPGLNLKGREQLIHELIDQGAEGVEVFNNYHSTRQVEYFAGEIKERAALMTCGSDFHGFTKPRIALGQYPFLEPYRQYLEMSLKRILT